MKQNVLKRKKSIIILFVSLVCIVSAGILLQPYISSIIGARNEINSLREERIVTNPFEAENQTDPYAVSEMFSNECLYNENQDFSAWLTIDNTKIDYPVMYTPSNPEYYIRRNFKKEYSMQGSLFFSEDSNIMNDSDNLIIYGHNMKSGDMFADLLNYQKESYWITHKNITLSTVSEVYQYEVIDCFYTELDTSNENTFRYDLFTTAESEEEFTDFMENVKQCSYYNTEKEAVYGDKLLTLSTCVNTIEDTNARIVVLAKRIS